VKPPQWFRYLPDWDQAILIVLFAIGIMWFAVFFTAVSDDATPTPEVHYGGAISPTPVEPTVFTEES
jgi:hypothetical protein